MKSWRLAAAKNNLDELIRLAVTDGPQTIRGRKGTVVVVSRREYKCMANKQPSFKEFLILP